MQLSDSAERDLKNFTDRGGFYPLRPIRTRRIKLSKIFKLNNSRLHLPVSRHFQEIMVCTYFCRYSPNSRYRSSTCIPPVLALISGSSWVIFFRFAKRGNFPPFCTALITQRNLVPRAFRLQSIFWHLCCMYHWRHFPHIADIFQIWSMLASYEKRSNSANQKRRKIVNE